MLMSVIYAFIVNTENEKKYVSVIRKTNGLVNLNGV